MHNKDNKMDKNHTNLHKNRDDKFKTTRLFPQTLTLAQILFIKVNSRLSHNFLMPCKTTFVPLKNNGKPIEAILSIVVIK